MSRADTFRRAYLTARAAGYPGTRRAFANLILATGTRGQCAAASAWAREHPEPEGSVQRRLAGARLRVVRDEPAERLLDHLGLDGDPDAG